MTLFSIGISCYAACLASALSRIYYDFPNLIVLYTKPYKYATKQFGYINRAIYVIQIRLKMMVKWSIRFYCNTFVTIFSLRIVQLNWESCI